MTTATRGLGLIEVDYRACAVLIVAAASRSETAAWSALRRTQSPPPARFETCPRAGSRAAPARQCVRSCRRPPIPSSGSSGRKDPPEPAPQNLSSSILLERQQASELAAPNERTGKRPNLLIRSYGGRFTKTAVENRL